MADVHPLTCVGFLIGAFVLAGLAHALWLASACSRRFALPLDGGRTFRGRRLLGDNKTWRGFMVMVPATGVAFALLAAALGASPEQPRGLWPLPPHVYGLLGVWAGLGFMLGELPNSFIKRQLAIPPGGVPAHPVARSIFAVLDRIDSVVGMLVALSVTVPLPWPVWAGLLIIGPAIHLLFSTLLWGLGVKERAA